MTSGDFFSTSAFTWNISAHKNFWPWILSPERKKKKKKARFFFLQQTKNICKAFFSSLW